MIPTAVLRPEANRGAGWGGRAGSMTIVEVTPTVGLMSPHGRSAGEHGQAQVHPTTPDAAVRRPSNAYTVSFSVATKTWPL